MLRKLKIVTFFLSQTFFHFFALTDKNSGIETAAELSFLQCFEHHVRFFLECISMEIEMKVSVESEIGKRCTS